MKTLVHLYTQSMPMEFENVMNSYTKDGLFCVMQQSADRRTVHKFPLQHIYKIVQEEDRA